VEVLKLLNGKEGRRSEESLGINNLCLEFELAQFGLKKLHVVAAEIWFEISASEFHKSIPLLELPGRLLLQTRPNMGLFPFFCSTTNPDSPEWTLE
jgi:hypothetical protein